MAGLKFRTKTAALVRLRTGLRSRQCGPPQSLRLEKSFDSGLTISFRVRVNETLDIRAEVQASLVLAPPILAYVQERLLQLERRGNRFYLSESGIGVTEINFDLHI